MSLSIAMLGATGHVGRLVLRNLLSLPLSDVSRVVTIDRRQVDFFDDDARRVSHVVDMRDVSSFRAAVESLIDGCDVCIATMGIGSGKGRPEQFKHVDVELPSAFAQAAVAVGAKRAVLLTSAGADIDKRFSLLLPHVARGQFFHLKGLVEQRFVEAGFSGGVSIFRPGGLLGTDHLPAFFDGILSRIDGFWPDHFKCIHIERLAEAITERALTSDSKDAVRIFEGRDLFELIDMPRTSSTKGL